MRLDDYLKKMGISQRALALRIGCNCITINRFIHGIGKLSLELATKIEEFTDGKVTRQDIHLQQNDDKKKTKIN